MHAYDSVMAMADLRTEQLRIVAAQGAKRRDHLGRLRDRMRELTFPESDPLLSAILREYEAACQTTVVATTAANSSETMRRKPWAGAG